MDKITPPLIHGYREKRLRGGRAARTVNLDTIALRNILKFAKARALIERLPETQQLKEEPPPERDLLTAEQFTLLRAAATEETTKNSVLFKYYLRFVLLTGAREKETLAVKWSDVDFQRQVMTIGKGGVAKNRKQRDVDYSPELATLLKEMVAARPTDTTWLFPSPQRGSKDIAAKSLRESLLLVREKAGLPTVGFHDLRHYFASQCVMAGIDFMTIASWLGHSDGGILVGKVYGHIADTHKARLLRR